MKYLGKELIQFSSQIKYTLTNYHPHHLKSTDFSNILICGLGGSGIAGKIVKKFLQDKIALPIEIVSSYTIPEYANAKTLVIVSSYSGDTQESLAMYEQAKNKNCQLTVLATGGKLIELAKRDNTAYFLTETGFQPRMALGYSLTYLLLFLLDLTDKRHEVDFDLLVQQLTPFENFQQQARILANYFSQTVRNKFIIVADDKFEAVAVRFAQQINENAKLEAFVTILPEANHNVLESYYGTTNSNFILLTTDVNLRINSRFLFIKELLKKNKETIQEIFIEDASLNSVLKTTYLLDWYSLHLADMVGAVSNKIDNILQLKSYLSKTSY
jgi:glucose/mannose-6-phosphate isomerase